MLSFYQDAQAATINGVETGSFTLDVPRFEGV
jgi:hypothetical protein